MEEQQVGDKWVPLHVLAGGDGQKCSLNATLKGKGDEAD
jgi:hypothetical protein